jgi:hypothetical protein
MGKCDGRGKSSRTPLQQSASNVPLDVYGATVATQADGVERPYIGSSRLMTQVEVAELVAQDSAASIYCAVIALQ